MEPPQPASGGILRSRMIERSPVYFGWLILAAGSFGLFMTTPGQTVGVSVFLDGIIADLGLSRATVSLMYTFATLAGSLALPFMGRLVDARGPRFGVVLIAALFALACAFMGLAVGGLLTLFVGFALIRSLGQGGLSLVSLHVINLWFVRRRGLAVGLSGIGFGLSFALFPPLIDALIGAFGWRAAYALLGALVAVTILPLGALLFRGQPERFGLLPDGRAVPGAAPLPEAVFTAAEARRSASFWLYALASFTTAMLGTALLFHTFDILGRNGVDRTLATAAFGSLGLVAAAATLVSGALLDRLPYRLMLAVELLLLIFVLLMAGRVGSAAGVILYGAAFGLMQGLAGAIQGSVWARLFGRRHLGAIKGTVVTIGVAGAALGPFLFAAGLELFGSYRPVLLLSGLLPLGLLLATPWVRPPRRAEGPGAG